MPPTWTAGDIFRISGSYWAGCALQAAVQLDLFTVLAKEPQDATALATKLGLNERALSMLITALISMGLLVRENGLVRVPVEAASLLSHDSPEYVGFIIKHHAAIMKNWTNLDQAVRDGALTREQRTVFTDNAAEREDFIMGMFNIARMQAGRIAEALDLSGRKTLLDVGGGPGTYAVFFCLQNPELKAAVFDLPTSEPFARRVIERYQLNDRVDFISGNFSRDALPGGRDVAWLSQVLHGENPRDAAALVTNAGKALNPGGLLCVQEFVLDDDRSGPEHAALFGLNMLVQTPGGQAYTVTEISDMLRAAGAARTRVLDVELPQSCKVIIGEMP